MTLSKFNLKNKQFYKEIIEHAESHPNEEVCGTVSLDKLLVTQVNREVNESNDRSNCFRISPSRIMETENILGIYHSHPKGGSEPSELDIKNSEEMCLPFLIYSNQNKDFYLYYPKSYEPTPLTGRPYIKGFYECVCTIKDYLVSEAGIKDDYTQYNYWPPDNAVEANKYLLKILMKRFNRIKNMEVKKHDIIIFDAGEPVFHVGMFMGNGEFVHQRAFHLSSKDEMTEAWQRRIKYIFRHDSFV